MKEGYRPGSPPFLRCCKKTALDGADLNLSNVPAVLADTGDELQNVILVQEVVVVGRTLDAETKTLSQELAVLELLVQVTRTVLALHVEEVAGDFTQLHHVVLIHDESVDGKLLLLGQTVSLRRGDDRSSAGVDDFLLLTEETEHDELLSVERVLACGPSVCIF
jgi:hypothetical protein